MSVKSIGIIGSILGILLGISFLLLSLVGGARPFQSILYTIGGILAFLGFQFAVKKKLLSNLLLIVGLLLLVINIPIGFVPNIMVGICGALTIARSFKKV